MSSIIFQNENTIYNNKKYQKRNKLESLRNKILKHIESNNSLKMKLFYQKSSKENSMRYLKHFKINELINIIPKNEINKKTLEYENQENKKKINTKSILPLLKRDRIQNKKILLNQNSLIDSNINNKDKDSDCKYLYLEYKKENNENKSNNEATYIEIDPQQIISSLTEFPNITQIFRILSKKINQRNIKAINKNNSDSKINIDEILDNLDKNRKNSIQNIINDNNNTFYINNDFFISSTIFIPVKQTKNNYSIQDLFLLDIINKVINKAIFFHDKKNMKINEDFILNEYKKQIKNLKIFFDEKINEKNLNNSLVQPTKEGIKNEIPQKHFSLRKKLFNNENNKGYINNISLYKNDMNMELFYNINNSKGKQEKIFSEKNRMNNLLNKPKLNIYNFEIGPKINIIDFNELLNKIHRQKVDIKNDNSNINENILKKLMELNKKKIKFENHMIEEKTKILTNKSNIFVNQNNRQNSRNIYNRKFNRKKLIIKNELFNDNKNNRNKKEKSLGSSKKETEETYSSLNDSYFLKIINKKETKQNSREKINIEKLGIKKDFGITKVGFNKTIDKLRRMHNNKTNRIRKKMKVYNFSFLNTIYGKINTQRKMKINEIDYKEEIKQKGYQLLHKIFRQNPKLELNKNISAENIFMLNDEKEIRKNFKTLDKGTSTRDISKFNWNKKVF